jgi:hypothetical protein
MVLIVPYAGEYWSLYTLLLSAKLYYIIILYLLPNIALININSVYVKSKNMWLLVTESVYEIRLIICIL